MMCPNALKGNGGIWLMKLFLAFNKGITDGPTRRDGPTDGHALTEMRGRN